MTKLIWEKSLNTWVSGLQCGLLWPKPAYGRCHLVTTHPMECPMPSHLFWNFYNLQQPLPYPENKLIFEFGHYYSPWGMCHAKPSSETPVPHLAPIKHSPLHKTKLRQWSFSMQMCIKKYFVHKILSPCHVNCFPWELRIKELWLYILCHGPRCRTIICT